MSLVSATQSVWGAHQPVELDPEWAAVHISRTRRRIRTQRDFDYY